MRRKNYLVAILAVVLCLGLLWAGCSGKKTENTAVRIGFLGKIDNLNVLETRDPGSWQVLDCAFRSMYQWDDKWQKQPMLAIEIPSIAAGTISADKNYLTITYKMKTDLKWSDGKPMQAPDVIFTYQLAVSPFFKEYNQSWVPKVRNARVQDNSAASFVLSSVEPDFDIYPLPREALAKAMESSSREEINVEIAKSLTYSGPYRIEKFTPRKIVLKKNDFFTSPAKLKNVELHFYHREEDLVNDLQKGNLEAGYGLSTEAVSTLAKNNALTIKSEVSAYQRMLLMNYKNPLIAKPEFRKALTMAVGKTALSESLYNSRIFAPQSWLSSRHPAYKPVLLKYAEATPDDVRNTFKQAGMEKNEAGTLICDEKPVTLMVMIVDGDRDAFYIARHVQESLKSQGIEVTVVSYPEDEYQRYLRARSNYDLALVTVDTSPAVSLTQIFKVPIFDTMTKGLAKEYTGVNYGGWTNSQDDELAGAFDREPDTGKRLEILRKQQDLFAENVPFIPIMNKPERVVFKSDLEGITPRGFGSITWNIEKWNWKQN